MRRATRIALAAALTAGIAAPNAHADGKPGDVVDPTVGQVMPSDAAQRLLRISHIKPQRARAARRTHRRYHASAARFSGHEQ